MFTADLFERMVRTFVGTFVTVFAASFAAPHAVADWGAWKAAGVSAVLAAGTAAFSAALGLITKPVGDQNSASMLPKAIPGTPVTRNVPGGSEGAVGASDGIVGL